MRLLKDVTVRLATDVHLAHVKDGDLGEFISTCVRDLKGCVHGITIEPDEWNRWHAYSVLDDINFSGNLLLPEEDDEGYGDAVVLRRRTGEKYVSGEFVGKKFLSVVASSFPSDKIATCEAIPVWSPGSTPLQLVDYMTEEQRVAFAELLAAYPGGYRRYRFQRALMRNRVLAEAKEIRPTDPVDEWLEDLRNEEHMMKCEAQWEKALERENEKWWRPWSRR